MISDNILNNNSIVFKFICKNLIALFTGDIEEIAEKRLCEMYKNTDKLKANILKVAHHGSKTSSTESFLELVEPEIVLIGVGENNNYGHPNEDVIARLQEYTPYIFRTDDSGEIVIRYSNGKMNVKKHLP